MNNLYLSMLSNNSIVLLLCMCTYGSWVHVQVCVHECETSLLPEPGAHWCLTSKSQSSSCLYLPAQDSQVYTASLSIFTWIPETKLRSSCMRNEHFVDWAISPVPTTSFWSWKTGSLHPPSLVNGGSRSPCGFTDYCDTLVEIILTPLYETRGFSIITGLREEGLPSI